MAILYLQNSKYNIEIHAIIQQSGYTANGGIVSVAGGHMTQNRLSRLSFLSAMAFLWLVSLPIASALAQDFGSQQPPPAPTNLRALYIGKQIILRWNEVATLNVTDYRIFRYDNSDKDKNVTMIAEVPKNKIVSQHEFIDKSAKPGQSYTYFVTAKNEFGLQSSNSHLAAVVKGY